MRLEFERTSGIHISIIEPGPIRSRFVERALANFRTTVDIEHSAHRETYLARPLRWSRAENSTFGLEPEAPGGVEAFVHALESTASAAALCGDHPNLHRGCQQAPPAHLNDGLDRAEDLEATAPQFAKRKVHHVAVLDDVLLAFEPHLAGVLGADLRRRRAT